ncbi:MAG: electron transfer flavoprotein subunit beta/FixA family protein [Desulfobacterium sp.]|nr:electron transfer flavoprotein subunit beta/FixA family protein [Desulfobacterium sp.]
MEVIVAIRQTPLLDGEIVLTADEKSVEIEGLKYHINEWDLYALEEALRLKTEIGARITAVSVGGKATEEAMYYCIAAGVDEAVLIEEESSYQLDSSSIATLLEKFTSMRVFDLFLTGVQSEDTGCGEVGAILATKLCVPQAAVVMKIKSLNPEESIVVQRELEDGFSDVQRLSLPALLTIQTGINQPRYVSTMHLRKARNKGSIMRISPLDLSTGTGLPAPKKTMKRAFLPEVGSVKLEFIDGVTAADKAKNIVDRLYGMEVL